ncbi:MAG: hypothetical protein U5L45_00440 [Saprospiraceae bacterium]|nr:hypothetical protein [Saprospiraceae bacterium]
MISQICEAIKKNILLAPYADKVAGLTRVAVSNVHTELEDGTSYKVSEKHFPVALNVSGVSCFNQNGYQDLCPNSQKKSVIYFEQIGATKINKAEGQGKNVKEFVAQVRCVAWFNLKKLGIEYDFLPCNYQSDLHGRIITPLSIECGTVSVKPKISILFEISDPSIFSKYSYDDATIQNMLLYPYYYLAIDFQISYLIDPTCHGVISNVAEIIC